MDVDFKDACRAEAIELAREERTRGESISGRILFSIDARGQVGLRIACDRIHDDDVDEALATIDVAVRAGERPIISHWYSPDDLKGLLHRHGATREFLEWLDADVPEGFVKLVTMNESSYVAFETVPVDFPEA